MIEQGGLIAACKYTNNFKSAYHDIGGTIEDLEAFKDPNIFRGYGGDL